MLLGRTDFNDWTEGQQGTSKALYVEKKIVNDIFTIVRHIGANAFGDRALRSAPLWAASVMWVLMPPLSRPIHLAGKRSRE